MMPPYSIVDEKLLQGYGGSDDDVLFVKIRYNGIDEVMKVSFSEIIRTDVKVPT